MFNLSPVYRWYYNKLESIESANFLRSLKDGKVLYEMITGIDANITFSKELVRNNVVLPYWALNPEMYQEISYDPQYAMVGIVNGLVCHAGALERWKNEFAIPHAFLNTELEIKVANLVHDTWITSQKKHWTFFVNLYFDFLYSVPDDDPVKMIDSWRCDQCRNFISQLLPEIAFELDRIPDSDMKTREEIVKNIVDLLIQEKENNQNKSEDNESQEESESPDSGQNESGDDSEDENDSPGDSEQEDQSDDQDDSYGKTGYKDSQINQLPFEEKIEALNQWSNTDEIPDQFIQAFESEQEDIPVTVKTIIEKTDVAYEPVDHNGEFKQLGTLLEEKYSQRPKKVRPDTTGKRLQKRHLHRLATDGRVFGTSKVKRKVLPKQIFFALDASGSINRTVGYQPILEAVSGALQGLKLGRNKCYTLAYTTNEENNPILTILGTPENLPRINAYTQLKNLLTPEPYMLSAMRGYIQKNRLPKHEVFLFVLNDGHPEMVGTSDATLVTMSQQQVKGLRKDGVNVIAFALTEEVIKSDSTIYGSDYTVDAQNLKQAVLKILSELD